MVAEWELSISKGWPSDNKSNFVFKNYTDIVYFIQNVGISPVEYVQFSSFLDSGVRADPQ